MASYNLVLDTKFRPFTYKEMLAPVAAATEAHQALESEYNELAVKASVWDGMADEQKDKETYQIYKRYADDLRNQANLLAVEGLNPLSRSRMLGMRRRYGEEIIPIEQAYKRREMLDKEEREALMRDDTIRYKRRAKDISLDEFRANPMLGHDESYSGKELTNTVANAVSSYVNAAINKGDLKSLGLPYQYTQDIQHGATPDQVYRAMNRLYQGAENGDPEAIKWLTNIRDQAIYNTGVADWEDPNALIEATNFANLGLPRAIGKTETRNYKDDAGIAAYNVSLQEAAAIRQHMREDPDLYNNDGTVKGVDPNVHNLYGTSDIAKQNEEEIAHLERVKTVWANPHSRDESRSPFDVPGIKGYETSNYVITPSPTGPRGSIQTTKSEGLKKYGITKENYDKYAKAREDSGKTPISEWEWVDYQINYRINERSNKTGKYSTSYHGIKVKTKEESDFIAGQMTSKVKNEGNVQKITGLHQNADGSNKIETESVPVSNFNTTIASSPIISLNNLPLTNNQFVELRNGEYYIVPPGTFSNAATSNLLEVNNKIRKADPDEEKFIEMNRANSYLQTLMDSNKGEKISYGLPIVSNAQ